MKTKRYWVCELDQMRQRTGIYYPIDVPTFLVINEKGLYYLGVDIIHNTGVMEKAGTCFLFTSEEQAQRAALD